MELVPLLDQALQPFLEPAIVLETPDVDDGGARSDQAQWARARREALARAEREGVRPGTPAWARADAPYVADGRKLATALLARAAQAEQAALATRAATLREAAATTPDAVIETRRRESREKLLTQFPEASDRARRILQAVQEPTAEARELLAAVLNEPAPRAVLADHARAEVEAALVRRRTPDVIRQVYRASTARRVAMDIGNAIGDPMAIKVGGA
jgi:hypothetical protein